MSGQVAEIINSIENLGTSDKLIILEYLAGRLRAEEEAGAKGAQRSFDVSDLTGRLLWKGDPVEEQRRIREEW